MDVKLLFNKENLAMILSIISITITVWNFISQKIKERVNLTIEVMDSWGALDGQNIWLDLSITNNSRLPLSINRIELGMEYSNGTAISRCLGKREIFKRLKTNGVEHDRIYAQELPAYLPTLGSNRGWYRFNSTKVPKTTGLWNLNCHLTIYCNNKKKRYPVTVPNKKAK